LDIPGIEFQKPKEMNMIGTNSFRRLMQGALLAAAALGIAACGGGSGGSPASLAPAACIPNAGPGQDGCGTVLVAVTDAEGDFMSYTVDVLSVSLATENGGSVETLPAATRIDFVQLTELADLLSAATVAPGNIVGGTIVLDYTNAEIFVESGNQIVPAEIVDSDGEALGVVELEIELADRERLVVTRGRTAFLSIDFDLAVSHTVDTSATPPRVVAEPYLVAEVAPLDEKELRVRGALAGVDIGAATYDVRVRPWFSRIGDHGVVTVRTTAATVYEIGDAMHTGAPGLEALASLATGTLTVAFGTLDVQERTFTAAVVQAGESLGGDGFSAVHGNIVARDGDRLTVKGAIAVRRDRPAHFHRTVLIDVGPETGVVKIGDADTLLDKGHLSVGQRIVAIGQFVNPDAAGADPFGPDTPLVLDATQGRVRMLVTRVHGAVTAILPGQVNLALRAIDRLGAGMFDFAGTGAVPGLDADPADYEIATQTLGLAALEVGRPARVLGFVAPFGDAPPDFEARTLVAPGDIPAVLGLGWGSEGTSAPFLSMGSEGVVPDLANVDIDERHHVLVGRELVDLLGLPSAPSIVPTSGRGLYGLWERGHVELFDDFGEFVTEIGARLNATDAARSLSAQGGYDGDGNVLTARRAVMHMIPAQ
jgi:hypothetical protein